MSDVHPEDSVSNIETKHCPSLTSTKSSTIEYSSHSVLSKGMKEKRRRKFRGENAVETSESPMAVGLGEKKKKKIKVCRTKFSIFYEHEAYEMAITVKRDMPHF